MLLVVDANVVFSALLKEGKTLDIFLLNRGYKRFEFVAPEFLMVEIKNHADEIVRRTGLSIEKLGKVLTFLEKEIEFGLLRSLQSFMKKRGKYLLTLTTCSILRLR